MILKCGCPGEYPASWHNHDIDIGGYCTHSLPIPTLLHMPVAYEIYHRRQHQLISKLGLREKWPGLVLTQTGMLRGKILRLVEDTQSLSRHVKYLPIPFHIRAYIHQGNVHNIRESIRKTQESLLDSALMPKELYLCHLTCPRCSKSRGGDKILLLRHWQESRFLNRKTRPSQIHH